MRKLLIANRKGGVGKTTTAVHIAHGMALAGLRVLLVDTDAQGHCAKMLGVQPEAGLAEYLEGSGRPEEARENLDLLAGGGNLAGTNRLISREDMEPHLVLSRAMAPLEERYDYAVIDTNPSYSPLNVNTYFWADAVLSPVTLNVLSIAGFLDLLGEMEPVRKRVGLEVRWIVPTIYDRRKGHTDEILPELHNAYGARVTLPIRHYAQMEMLPKKGVTVFEHDDSARPALDYAKLVGEILKDGEA